MAEPSRFIEVVDVIGVLASVVGLGLTLYLLSVAKGARQAAEQAREAALSSARRRSLSEELENVRRMVQQVGNLLQQEEWLAVQMRTEEILGTCRAAMARWGDGLSVATRDDVLRAANLVKSIAQKSSEYGDRDLTPAEKNKLTSTHLTASGLIHVALGEAHRQEERDDNGTGN